MTEVWRERDKSRKERGGREGEEHKKRKKREIRMDKSTSTAK
jgi:hypothetical protein